MICHQPNKMSWTFGAAPMKYSIQRVHAFLVLYVEDMWWGVSAPESPSRDSFNILLRILTVFFIFYESPGGDSTHTMFTNIVLVFTHPKHKQ